MNFKYILFACLLVPFWLMGMVPKEDLYFNELGPKADYIVVYRPFDNKQYRIYPGIGCFMALMEDLNKNTNIYATKFGDLLEPYGNGNIAMLYIETPYRSVMCKIVHIQYN